MTSIVLITWAVQVLILFARPILTAWQSRGCILPNARQIALFARLRALHWLPGCSLRASVALGTIASCLAANRLITRQLRDYNYYVGCVGKLDLAKPDGYNGRDGDRPATYMWGFTHPVECEGKMHAGHSKTPQGPYNHFLEEKGLLGAFVDDYTRRSREGYHASCHDSVLPTEAFEDVYIGQRSVEWIENIPGDFPWHLFVSFVGPHDPFDPPAEYGEKYRDAEMPPATPANLPGKPAYLKDRIKDMTPEKIAETRRQ